MELKEKIINDIKSNAIILYMKGTKNMPQCGFKFCSPNIKSLWYRL